MRIMIIFAGVLLAVALADQARAADKCGPFGCPIAVAKPAAAPPASQCHSRRQPLKEIAHVAADVVRGDRQPVRRLLHGLACRRCRCR